MSQSDENHQDLREKLDEAGRLWRPRHPGWNSLLDRLPPREPTTEKEPPNDGSSPKQFRWWTLAIAASILVAIVSGFFLLLGPNRSVLADSFPIEVIRRGIQVTIFNASDNREPTLYMPTAENAHEQSPGMALVKDQRMILHLKEGDNEVKFTDVAATIDPTSVRLVSDTDPVGTKVIEQNFEFDLANADAILKRSLEEKIACVGKDNGELYEGYLLSYDNNSIVLSDKRPSDVPKASLPNTQTISRTTLQTVRLESKPTDLYTRPTLVWRLRTQKPGTHHTTLTYLCGNALWRADYVALIRESGDKGDTLDLKAWVTIDNRSGTTYEDAGLKLIAGDVNRVRDPWAPRPRRGRSAGEYAFAEGRYADRFDLSLGRKQFQEKSFFEYKLYTLSQPSTIKDQQIKQLSLFQTADVKARRRYVCRSQDGDHRHAEVQLLIRNKKENQLGRPLPKGTLALTAIDADGDTHLLGRHQIDHTAKDEEFRLQVGRAFDVVYSYRLAKEELSGPRRMLRTYEFRIRNHKAHEVQVRTIGRLSARRKIYTRKTAPDGQLIRGPEMRDATSWTITQTTDPYVKYDHRTVYFDVQVPANSEKTITYTAEYGW
ncbi:MAG: hypothetical protein ISR77_27515 [Pirellulaceae bacterium]|nr:hypothetical protein [Pirellulaceae bacterium]